MGATLSEPETTKETHSCANSYVKVGSSSMQGWRISMEDAHTHLLAMPDDKDASFFGVFDGHGGASVSQHASYNLHKFIVQTQAYRDGGIVEAIQEGFLKMDEEILNNAEIRAGFAGTTANIVMIKNDMLYCGNVGDSRAVISRCGCAEALSVDHKPLNEPESERIYAAGGWVEFNRVNGNLAMSRALGDFIYKQNEAKSAREQIVVAYPDVLSRKITDDDEFVLLACDGIWDVLTNQEVVDFCRDRIAIGMEPENICEEMLLHCLAPDCQMAGLGCDNMTVILVCLLQNRPYQELQKKCQRRRPSTPVNDVDFVIGAKPCEPDVVRVKPADCKQEDTARKESEDVVTGGDPKAIPSAASVGECVPCDRAVEIDGCLNIPMDLPTATTRTEAAPHSPFSKLETGATTAPGLNATEASKNPGLKKPAVDASS